MRVCLHQVGLWQVCGIVLIASTEGKTRPECEWHRFMAWSLNRKNEESKQASKDPFLPPQLLVAGVQVSCTVLLPGKEGSLGL